MQNNFKIDMQVDNCMEPYTMIKPKLPIYYHSHKNKKCQQNNNYKQFKEDMISI